MTTRFEPNAVQCMDCDEIYEGEHECPEEPSEHGYWPVQTSRTPLLGDEEADRMAYHHGRRDYVYEEDAFRGRGEPTGGSRKVPLPEMTPRPCNDCPWRRASAPGWLGPHSREDWIGLAGSEQPIACHQTIRTDREDGEGDWSDPAMRQCAGAAIYRKNTAKLPQDPQVAVAPHPNTLDVFATPREFLDHHGRTG